LNTKRFLIVCFVVGAVSFSLASAQMDGAVVVRGEDTGWFQLHHNGAAGDASIISLNSTNSEFFCDEGGYDTYWKFRTVYGPGCDDLATCFDTNYRDHGLYFVRVWFATLDEFFSVCPPDNVYCDNVCDWVNNGEHDAEGIVQAGYFDNDEFDTEPGAAVWGHHYAGGLYSDACGGHMTGFNLIRRWKILPSGEFSAQVSKGPKLSCE